MQVRHATCTHITTSYRIHADPGIRVDRHYGSTSLISKVCHWWKSKLKPKFLFGALGRGAEAPRSCEVACLRKQK